jgi:hypothetical protein
MYGYLPGEEWNVSPRQTAVDHSAIDRLVSKFAADPPVVNQEALSQEQRLPGFSEKSSHDGVSLPQSVHEDGNGSDRDTDHRVAASNRPSKVKMRGEAKRLVPDEENDERTLLLLPLLRALARCDIEAQTGESMARLLRE